MHSSPVAVDPVYMRELAGFAESLADAARPFSRKWFRREVKVDTKADDSPVTIADREVEAMLRHRIARQFPQHGVLGEELGEVGTGADYVWLIDPIDGTRSFISGNPLWGTLLALLYCGRPVLGVIDMPVVNERWVGVAGQPTHFNGEPCYTRECRGLKDAAMYSTSPDLFGDQEERMAFERLSAAVRMRRFGGDCYNYALLAAGYIDLVVESGLQPYDYLALAPVVEGAGGVITDWSGRSLDLHSSGQVLAAANTDLHRQAAALIENAPGTSKS